MIPCELMEIPLAVLLPTLLHFILAFSPAESLAGNESDYLALLAIKRSVSVDPLGLLNYSWNHTVQFCQWPGVACNRRDQRVTSLNLTGWSLKGSVSPYIANLSFLERMDLSVNDFNGGIPEEFGRLARLQNLNLSYNFLSGKLPDTLSNCSELKVFDVDRNQISGNIPDGFGSLSKLAILSMKNNKLSGSIPASLGNLSSLTHFLLAINSLQGRIPDEIGRLSKLQQFYVGANVLSGKLPESFYNLSSIYLIGVVDNEFEGSMPSDLGLRFPKLQIFAAGMNQFTGPIPVSLSNASGLLQADFGYNNFTGSVPKNLGVLKGLTFLSFAYNQLGSWGEVDDLGFLSDLTNCSNLETLPLGNNHFGGEVPKSIGNFSTRFKYLNLGVNQIGGSIPREIENLVGMTELALQQNRFTGDIPSGIGKLNKLEELDMSENRLSGRILYSLGNMTRLSKLLLFKNNLEGSIPPSLGNCKSLAELDLSENNLNDTIPKEIVSLVSLSKKLDMSSNFFTGSLPLEVGQLVNLGVFSVSNNLLSGEVPSTLGSCIGLEYLYMARNLFHGPIPSSLTELKAVLGIDLSSNNLSGVIPKYLQDFTALRYLNLSFNNLEGEVPTEGVFRNATGIGVVGNSRLCGGNSALKLPPCHREARGKGRRSLLLKVVIVSCSVAVLLLTSVAAILGVLHWKGKRRRTADVTVDALGDASLPVSYVELFRATEGFSTANLIGVGSYGSVYKGTLEHYQTAFAIKVLNLQQRGALRSFLTECEALRNIRHRNLVKIVTACSSLDFNGNDFKALVYEFMSNGSLEKWLHGPRDEKTHEGRSLTLLQRLNIAIDVAYAMDYLHQHCHTTIVHCDLKPSNILLDDELKARVSDFGLARIFAETNTSLSRSLNSTTGIRGTIGYVAPEYGMSVKPSTKGDVYSYGILVLEMFTGKAPIDEIFKDGANVHQFVKQAPLERVWEMADRQLLQEDDDDSQHLLQLDDNDTQHGNLRRKTEECLVRVLDLGVLCSAESPKERPEMEKVIVELLKIKEIFGERSP
ncbi:probable LRR receptor-like serine/threonine-protein kinase At3g47570 [Aristolochia californica]|uniref:probable LRR receptor-like serine/threonine-protein kinase At3g47570 n=1 Tax=Aristolochia californica TaxID=171875 RepID=UPI0035DA9CF4